MHINTKCSIAVHCLIFIHEYGKTDNVTSGLLAKSTGCNPVGRSIRAVLQKPCAQVQQDLRRSLREITLAEYARTKADPPG